MPEPVRYLREDILVKVDRASMAASLEVRSPFLDERVMALAWRFPDAYKGRGGAEKWAVKRLAERHIPKALLNRPKMGFGIPLAQWLRGPLRDWAEPLLSAQALGDLLHPAPIRRRWEAHLSGREDHAYALWNILSLQHWRSQAHER